MAHIVEGVEASGAAGRYRGDIGEIQGRYMAHIVEGVEASGAALRARAARAFM